ncbi:1,4-alpha-glucan branching protein GlgB [bacterium]|nr:1,4-alpha-glucan branching protein GlgB [bacterium]
MQVNKTVSPEDLSRILRADHADPFSVLGMHVVSVNGQAGVAVRAFLPEAREVAVWNVESSARYGMARVHEEGFFEAVVFDWPGPFTYQLEWADGGGERRWVHDPYSFPPVLSDYDLHLFGEGTHLRLFETLGAHPMSIRGVNGMLFAVWAPNARRTSVVGDFCRWDGRRYPMRTRGGSGVWELFIPDLGTGALYKYEVRTQAGRLLLKSDPCATRTELRPNTASITHGLPPLAWNDAAWMAGRAVRDPLEGPMAVYEVHPGSWRRVPGEGRPLTYREMASALVDYVAEMGFTHVQFMPVTEHPLDDSWGYQVTGYFAPTSRFGTPEDFATLVDAFHRRGIGVLIDCVPGHFPRDAHGLAEFDGTSLYEHADPRQGEHRDWGTKVFNYGRNEVRCFLLSSVLFWFERYHIDGARVDAVASMLYLDYSRGAGEWMPNRYGGRENLEAIDFLKQLNEAVYARFPGVVTIAEESTSWPGVSRPTYLGGLGFGMKWNMGWMHDILDYMSHDPVHRKFHHDHLTFGLLYAFHENFVLPLSHDEVVYGKRSLLSKMPGDAWQKFANLRLLYGFMYGHPGKKHLFMGGEFGQWDEWDHRKSLDWHLLQSDPHRRLQAYVRDLNRLYRSEPALYEVDFHHRGFEWIDFRDTDQGVVSFLRRAKDGRDFVVFVCNFTPVPRLDYRVGVPAPGFYRELINSDAEVYGGGNVGNWGEVQAEAIPWHGRDYSVRLAVPPLAVLILKRSE